MPFLAGWNKRKNIIVTGQSGAGSNYQIKLLVGESSGSPGVNFHVESHSSDFPADKNDGGDLRFTDNDGETLLSFWVESVSGVSPNRVATIWVKVADSLDSNADIYCYYDKSGASNASNGDDTFLLFDDFDGVQGVVDAGKWSAVKQGSSNAVVEKDGSGNLHLAGEPNVISSGNAKSVATFTNNLAIRARRKYSSANYVDLSLGSGDVRPADFGLSDWWHTCLNLAYFWMQQALNGHYLSYIPDGANRVSIVYDTSNSWGDVDTYEIIEFTLLATGVVNWIQNAVSKLSGTDDRFASSSKYLMLSQGEHSGGQGGDSLYDYILIRKLIATEPAFSSADSEESSAHPLNFGFVF